MSLLLPKQNNPTYPDKIKLIKHLNCLARNWHGRECCEGVDPAHYRYGLYLGANIKDDLYITPLCRVHHSLQGDMGEKKFWGERLEDAKVQTLLLHIAYLNDDFEEMKRLVREF